MIGRGEPAARIGAPGSSVLGGMSRAADRAERDGRRRRTARGVAWPALPAMLFVAVAGCAGGPSADDAIPVPLPELPPSDGIFHSPELQAVVDLQVERDGPALRALLESPDAAVRARASLALGSVQDPEAMEPLERALGDESPAVRANAAFALGQLLLPDGGQRLLEALSSEGDPQVRRRLLEAIGKRGASPTIGALIDRGPAPGEELYWTRALARAATRELRSPGLPDALADRLVHPDPEVRLAAGYYFGRTSTAGPWIHLAPLLRAALDGYSPDEPTAMHLVTGLARLANVQADAERLARWMTGAADWRTRANAAGAMTSPLWMGVPEIREALLDSLDDPSEHVRVVAATSFAFRVWNTEEERRWAESHLRGPIENWRAQAPFLDVVAAEGDPGVIVSWTRRAAAQHPVATQRGIEALASISGSEVSELLFELADHEEPLVRAGAVAVLAQRWMQEGGGDEVVGRYFELFRRRVADEANLPAARAASALSASAFQSLGGAEVLDQAFRARRAAGDPYILIPLLEAMGPESLPLLEEVAEGPDPRLAAVAARGVRRIVGGPEAAGPLPPPGMEPPAPERYGPERRVDWAALAAIGPEPRIRMETERGELVLRLYPEQAPLTVQAFVEQVEAGRHDGVRFHRVVPNFVVQGGDFAMGDGTGGPGYSLRSEYTQLPFRRGVVGMATSGKDTEGSQFFLTHSDQPHLDGGYTAVGWVESGGEVLDLLQQGDRVLRMRLEP